jgi:hypothetical protein
MSGKWSAATRRALRIAALILAVLLFAALVSRREAVVGMGQAIQFDDFAFAVTGVRRIEVADAKRAGMRYVVKLSVSNRAKRVGFQFRRDSAILVDAKGREYRPTGPAPANDPCAGSIPAGGSCTTELAYEVPADVHEPRLRISFGPAGDFLESLFYGSKRIQLP